MGAGASEKSHQAGTRRGVGGLPITITLATAIGLLVLLASATVLTLQWHVSRKNTFELVNEISELVIESLESGIRGHLTPALDQAEFVGQHIEQRDHLLADKDKLFTLLTGALSAAPQITALGIWDLELQRTMVARDPTVGVIRIDRNDRQEPDIVDATRQLARHSGPYWGNLVRDDDGLTFVNLRRPLRRDGALIGYLFSAIAAPELSKLVADTGDEFGATGFVLYGRDRVLAHPNLVDQGPGHWDNEVAAPIDAAGDLVLSSLWKGVAMRGFSPSAANDIEVVKITFGDQDYVALHKSLTEFGEVPWTFGLWFPLDDVDQVIKRLRGSALAGIGLVLLSIGAAVFLGHLIAKPVRAAALGTARIGDLDLEQVKPLASSLFRELNDQARAFNAMLVSLRAFETYVPKALVQRLIRQGEKQAVVSEERELTVLFTDVVGFTTLSERSSASEVAAFLNQHFALLADCVRAESGTIDKFIGDALMAFWGAPDRQSDTAQRACRAALCMAHKVADDNERRRAAGEMPIGLRIGIHSGPVVVGNIGAPGRINYTIVGDSVNVGQRLEALGKSLGQGEAVTILISESTAQQLDESFELELAGDIAVKGRREPVKVYRLLG